MGSEGNQALNEGLSIFSSEGTRVLSLWVVPLIMQLLSLSLSYSLSENIIFERDPMSTRHGQLFLNLQQCITVMQIPPASGATFLSSRDEEEECRN